MKFVSRAIIYLFVLLVGCGGSTAPSDKFAGNWESHSFKMSISRKGDTYLIDLDNHRGMLSGQYTGELVGGRIRLTLPLAGEQLIRMSESGDRLHFIGEQMDSVRP